MVHKLQAFKQKKVPEEQVHNSQSQRTCKYKSFCFILFYFIGYEHFPREIHDKWVSKASN